MSADGTRFSMIYKTATSGYRIYYSSDSATTFLYYDFGATNLVRKIEMNASGRCQVAIVGTGSIYVSSDYGASWSLATSSSLGVDIAMSASGLNKAAVGSDAIYGYLANPSTNCFSSDSCSAINNSVVVGACGSSAGGTFTSAPASNLCNAGSATSVVSNTSTYTWDCTGSGGGATANCTATRAFVVTYTSTAGGSCSPASRTVAYNATSAAPTCTPNAGYTLTGFTRTSGSGGTLNASTGAVTNVTGTQTIQANFSIAVVNGVCGSASGTPVYIPPTANLCNAGTATVVTTNATTFTWNCTGSGGGATVNCSANQLTRAIPCGTYGDTNSSGFINYYDVVYGIANYASLPLTITDMNNDGTVTNADLLLLQDYVNGSIATFPVCSVVVGVCGSSNGGTFSSAPASNLCLTGTASAVTTNTSTYTWDCGGSGGGGSASCSANRIVNGSCGASNGGSFLNPPASNLCSLGTASSVTTNPTTYTWNCIGINTGTTASCSASRIINGVCGTAAKTYLSTDAGYGADTFCSAGTASPLTPAFPAVGGSTTWNCVGSGTGALTATCTANRSVAVVNGDCGTADTHGYPSTGEIDTIAERCTTGIFTSFTDAGATWTWQCTGSGTGVDANCFAKKVIPGSSFGKVLRDQPVTNLCLYGTPTPTTFIPDIWYWGCTDNPGVNATAYAYKTTCGSDNGQALGSLPTNLCKYGTPSGVTTNVGTYDWTCTGDDALPVACSATRTNLDGVCGTADGHGYYSTIEINTVAERCGTGTFTSFVDAGATWTWQCQGTGGASDANCFAKKVAAGSSSGKTWKNEPTTNLCLYGTPTPTDLVADIWTWDCTDNPGVNAAGVAYKTTCGSDNGQSLITIPTNLCKYGTPSGVITNVGTYDWTCTGDDALPVACSAINASVSGVCGTADGHGYYSTSEIDEDEEKCEEGTFTSFTDSGTTWTWQCTGSGGGGIDADCSAMKVAVGSASGKIFKDEPTTNLCIYGSPTPRNLISDIWYWYCTNNPGKDAIGFTYKTTCGSSNGASFSSAPIANLCKYGTASGVSGSGPWTWTCTGDDSLPVSCSANPKTSKDRQFFYSESTVLSTYNAGTAYQDKATLIFTPDPNSEYLIIASWLMNESSVSYQVKAKLTRITGTSKDFNELIYQPKDATDYISGGAIGIDSFGAAPGMQVYRIQYATNNTLGTARIRDAKIIAIKLTPADEYAQEEVRTTTSAVTSTDKTTLSFTPATPGNYIVIASATVDGNNANYDFVNQLNIDGLAYSNQNLETAYANNRYLWAAVKRVNFDANPHTIKIQYNAENATYPAGINHARIIALRADEFTNDYYAEVEDRNTPIAPTFSTAYVDKTVLTEVTQASNHLILGSAGIDGASTSYSSYGQLIRGATVYGESILETKDILNQGSPFFVIKKEYLNNASSTWKIQNRAESASYAAGIKDARISVIELMPVTLTVSSTGTQNASLTQGTTNNYVGGAFTLETNTDSTTISQITISDKGTINANTNLSNLKIYYEIADTCNYDGTETLFGTAASFNASDKAVVSGTMNVSTSQVCLYVVLDIGSGAGEGEIIDIEISNPSTEITASSANNSQTSPVTINGISTVEANTFVVTYTSTAGGSCLPASVVVASGGTASAPTCTPNAGYTLAGFTRTSGSGGTLNASTGEVINVTGNQTIEASFTSAAITGVCGSDDGQILSSDPTNLCSAGTPTAVTGTYTWICEGSGGGLDDSCSATQLSFISPLDSTAEVSCLYCDYYTDYTDGNLVKKGSLTSTGEVPLTTSFSLSQATSYPNYKLGVAPGLAAVAPTISTGWFVFNGSNATSNAIVVAKGSSATDHVVGSSLYITYGNGTSSKDYTWFIQFEGEGIWRKAGTFSTPKKPYPIVRVAANKTTAIVGETVQYCTTTNTLSGITDTSNCFNVCWKGIGTTASLTSTDWKCSVCYNSIGDPTLCSAANGNLFSWAMPIASGTFVSSTLNSANPQFKYSVATSDAQNIGLTINGSECSGEGETGSTNPLPIWREGY